MALGFLDLPGEILCLIPPHLHSIFDLYSLLLTCRTFYEAFYTRGESYFLPPVLPNVDGQYLLTPHPHLLLAGTIRQVADWAISSYENQDELYECLAEGADGLLELVQRIAKVSLFDMRRIHEKKHSLLRPLSRIVDIQSGLDSRRRERGQPSIYDDDQNSDGPEEGLQQHQSEELDPGLNDHAGSADDESAEDNLSQLTICEEPDLAVLNSWMYAELFHHYIDAILNSPNQGPTTSPSYNPTLDLRIRHRFLAFCLPDYNNHRNPNWKMFAGSVHDPTRPTSDRGKWQHLDILQMHRATSVRLRNEALYRYFTLGLLRETAVEESRIEWESLLVARAEQGDVEAMRAGLCCLVARHIGHDGESLGWSIPGVISADASGIEARLREIRDAVSGIPSEDIKSWFMHDYDGCDGWWSWYGMEADVNEGIETHMWSDEAVMEEERRLERRRLERRGWIAVSVP